MREARYWPFEAGVIFLSSLPNRWVFTPPIASAASSTAGAIPSANGRTEIVIVSVNWVREKSPSDVKQLTLFRQRIVLMRRQEQCFCFSHEGDRIRSSPHPLSPAPEPRRLPLAGVLFLANVRQVARRELVGRDVRELAQRRISTGSRRSFRGPALSRRSRDLLKRCRDRL